MQAPVDYPIVDPARDTRFSVDELTYAVLLDRMYVADESPASETEQSSRPLTTKNRPEKSATTQNTAPGLKPFSVIVKSLRSSNGQSFSLNSGMFSRWSRALR